MSCIIDAHRHRGCRDSASGVVKFFLANMPDGVVTSADYLTFDTDGHITALSGTTTGLTLYEYVPEKTSSMAKEEIGSAIEVGSVTYNQSVEMVFAGISQEMQNQIKALTSGSFVVITQDKNGNFILFGENDSMSATGGGLETGAKSGELSGYKLTLSSEEGSPAPMVDAAAVADALAS